MLSSASPMPVRASRMAPISVSPRPTASASEFRFSGSSGAAAPPRSASPRPVAITGRHLQGQSAAENSRRGLCELGKRAAQRHHAIGGPAVEPLHDGAVVVPQAREARIRLGRRQRRHSLVRCEPAPNRAQASRMGWTGPAGLSPALISSKACDRLAPSVVASRVEGQDEIDPVVRPAAGLKAARARNRAVELAAGQQELEHLPAKIEIFRLRPPARPRTRRPHAAGPRPRRRPARPDSCRRCSQAPRLATLRPPAGRRGRTAPAATAKAQARAANSGRRWGRLGRRDGLGQGSVNRLGRGLEA